jgi:hypothetical protein
MTRLCFIGVDIDLDVNVLIEYCRETLGTLFILTLYRRKPWK